MSKLFCYIVVCGRTDCVISTVIALGPRSSFVYIDPATRTHVFWRLLSIHVYSQNAFSVSYLGSPLFFVDTEAVAELRLEVCFIYFNGTEDKNSLVDTRAIMIAILKSFKYIGSLIREVVRVTE